MAQLAANETEREIRTSSVDFSFGELLNLHKSNEIIIQPEYQRLFRWSDEQRSRLIESILLGLPIPPIFLIENDTGVLELIDGLQRTSSVLQFLDHSSIDQPELVLIGCDFIKELNGLTFNQIDISLRLKIKRTPIRATIINKTGSSFVKYELFKRLNTGGSMLSAQEIRNCSSRMVDGGAEFYGILQSLAQSECFKRTISRLPETMVEQRADEELVLRYFALIASIDTFKGNIEDWLDGFMERILFRHIDFNKLDIVEKFNATFGVIAEKFGDGAFTRFNVQGESTGRLAPAYFEAVCAAVTSHLEEIQKTEAATLLKRLQAAFDSEEFKAATGPGANTIPKLNQRIRVVSEYLVGHVGN